MPLTINPMPTSMKEVDRILKSPSRLQADYQDVNLGIKLDNSEVKKYLIPLTNTAPISLKVVSSKERNSTIQTVVLSRGRWWEHKQNLVWKVETDHFKYFDGYAALELLFSKYLEYEQSFNERLHGSKVEPSVYVKLFHILNIDHLPDLIHYVNHHFTFDVPAWVRFKRLFMSIMLTIDPVIIDTIKFKMFQYLVSQLRSVHLSGIDLYKPKIEIFTSLGQLLRVQDQRVEISIPPSVLHRLMDMYLILPYGYLFFVAKSMDLNGAFSNRFNMDMDIHDFTENR